ncbi:hypothetical protein GCM10027084_08080 [Pseudoxanthomonas sangjuensis]|uniref:DUF3426 domain-containing protein n=1 Tax=Pseudoxanthomonas sangjuensis TaxID=1503750 RepID=UPI001FE65D65|nr:DUF3426 domain-containing protein [Pseudoxanthomonas sangjuensis]
MPRICPHCWHSLDAALRANPALTLCPDCGGDIGNDATAEPVTAASTETAAPEQAATDGAKDETGATATVEGPALDETGAEASPLDDAIATEAALEAIEQECEAEAGSDAAEPLPELEAQAEGVAESIAGSAAIAADAAPSFTRDDAPVVRVRTHPWQWAALMALGLLLGVQILLADRERFAADANWRPVLGAACETLGCKLPPWREPQAFAMLSRDVRPVPDAPGTLLVQATFRNDARWPQPWPALQLTLSDADGRVVGARVFTAKEYLDKSVTQTELSPGQSAQVSFRLREPKTPAVAFTFDFR